MGLLNKLLQLLNNLQEQGQQPRDSSLNLLPLQQLPPRQQLVRLHCHRVAQLVPGRPSHSLPSPSSPSPPLPPCHHPTSKVSQQQSSRPWKGRSGLLLKRGSAVRNIQVLLDAAVMEMQQYSTVVARNSTYVPTPATIATTTTSTAASPAASETSTSSAANTTTTSSSTASIVSSAAETTTTSTTSSLGSSSSASTSLLSPAAPSTAEVDTAQISASTPATQEPSSSVSASTTTLNTSSETGARPKTSSNVSLEKKETDSEKEKNPFESLTKDEGSSGRTAEQEEMRRKRLAVFEEQKKRLMNQ